jgi:hypothetical protein
MRVVPTGTAESASSFLVRRAKISRFQSDKTILGAPTVRFSTLRCRHLEGKHAVVYYRPGSDKNFTGEVTRLEIRDDRAVP